MEKTKRAARRAFVDGDACVACGCCVKVCPLGALAVARGIAVGRCVGCGKCARECPTSVIEIREVTA